MATLEDLNRFNDRELLARTLQAEAGNQDVVGKLAVGAVIQNRASEGGYGSGVRGVITKPGQFSPLNYYTGYASGSQGVNLSKVRPDKETYAVADAILSGEYVDPTGGATHFYNPSVSAPSWGKKSGEQWMPLGDHIFGRANAGRDDYIAPTSDQTYASRRVQYGLGDRGPGTTADVLRAVARGDMTKSEASKYVSEGLLEGFEGGSAYDILQGEEDQASFLDRLGDAAAGMEAAGLFEEPAMPSRLSTAIYEGRPNSGTRALKRMGIASLA